MDDRNIQDLARQRYEVIGIIEEAVGIYTTRDLKYKGLWTSYGAQDCVHHLRSKALRAFKVINEFLYHEDPEFLDEDDIKEMTEDALDAIVYAAFTVYCVRHHLLRNKEEDEATE